MAKTKIKPQEVPVSSRWVATPEMRWRGPTLQQRWIEIIDTKEGSCLCDDKAEWRDIPQYEAQADPIAEKIMKRDSVGMEVS